MSTVSAPEDTYSLVPDDALVDRFRRSLDTLAAAGESVGLAVSGGPDSLALLLLAAAARPGKVEAATVDHALREGSAEEAAMVSQLCEKLGVPHRILTAEWKEKPETAIQERARAARYALLGKWAAEQGLKTVATGHHLDDQAETIVMRLSRGAGVRGLGAMRRLVPLPGGKARLARPLLGWRRSELDQICAAAGLDPVNDPTNADAQFERTRVRNGLAAAEWLDPAGLAKSAIHLSRADQALGWTTALVWRRSVRRDGDALLFQPRGVPQEIVRRVAARAVGKLASEGSPGALRGAEVDRLMAALVSGRKATLRGVLCSGGAQWRFERAPARAEAAPAS